jgi:hypothetical protein
MSTTAFALAGLRVVPKLCYGRIVISSGYDVHTKKDVGI